MVQMVLADPEKTGSTAPVEIPDHGIVTPILVSESERTKAEWESYIKRHKLPLIVKDVKAAEAAEEE